MRAARRYVPLISLLLFVAGLSLRPMAETDLFFRVRVGREILAHHGLLGRNLLSFTYPDYPDLDAAWLFEVAAAGLYGRFGFGGVVVAKAVVLLSTIATLYWVARRAGAGRAASAAMLGAAAAVANERFVERPHVLSFLGEAFVLSAITALLAPVGPPRASRRVLLVLVSLWVGVALWANFHAGVFVAPIILIAAAIGAALDGEGAAARRLAVGGIGAALATLATPLGVGLYRYLALHPAITAVHPVDEFRRPDWTSDAPLFVYVAAVSALWLAATSLRRAAPKWTGLAVVAPLLAIAGRSVRFGADLVLVLAPFGAVAMSRLVETAGRAGSLAAAPSLAVVRAGPVAVCAFLVGAALLPLVRDHGRLRVGLETRDLPLSAIAFANENGLRDRMYNDFEIGSYLLFTDPGHKVFVDPRLPAYPLEMHRLLGRSDLTRREWGEAMDRYSVDTALLAYGDVNRRVSWWDPDEWALVFRADDARVFVRRTPGHLALIAAREIPATFMFSFEEGNQIVPLAQPPAASPVPGCEWQRRLGDLLLDVDGTLSPRALRAYAASLAEPRCLALPEASALCRWLRRVRQEVAPAACAIIDDQRAPD